MVEDKLRTERAETQIRAEAAEARVASLVEAIGPIIADMREIVRDGSGNIQKQTAVRWADALAGVTGPPAQEQP